MKTVMIKRNTNVEDVIAWKVNEKISHLEIESSRSCPNSKKIWKEASNHLNLIAETDFMKWVQINSKNSSTSSPLNIPNGTLFIYLLWQIWTVRNKKIFENTDMLPKIAFQNALAKAVEFIHLGNTGAQSSNMINVELGWSPPPEGCFKLNVDGSCMGNLDIMVAVGVIWVPKEAKVAVIDVMMDVLGADRVYSVIGRHTVSRGYCYGTVTALMDRVPRPGSRRRRRSLFRGRPSWWGPLATAKSGVDAEAEEEEEESGGENDGRRGGLGETAFEAEAVGVRFGTRVFEMAVESTDCF
ncbi:reverse transcriptase [Senna tora]|uniref:Reverse transcriptase n=1 Tax=Senna tora TaxID=362788 RepID=A0A834SZV9_9FABA|nr:reverse transcriptase [Senna tora]